MAKSFTGGVPDETRRPGDCHAGGRLFLCRLCGWSPIPLCYASTARVEAVTGELVTVVDGSKRIYHFWGAEGYQVGDLVSLTMHDNHTTNNVYDDIVVRAAHAGRP